MAIRKISVKNFKSFRDMQIELGDLNILIGANASGKSNFVEIFRFLRDIKKDGLENAISMQGGVEYLRNVNIGTSENLSLEVISDQPKIGFATVKDRNLLSIIISKATYWFDMEFDNEGLDFDIVNEGLVLECEHETVSGKIIISNNNGKISVDLDSTMKKLIGKDYMLSLFGLPSKDLLIERPFLSVFPLDIIFSEISVYNFDPRLSKKAVPITGKAELEEDGSNLAIVLKNILGSESEKNLVNLLTYTLPFVNKLDVEKFADKSLLFTLKEIYSDKQIPASLISDGTINITALIIALYFEKKSLTIIEEPERNIHPHLISKVVDMMREASKKKQIIVTTHNPEMVRHADLKHILLVSRDEDGFSSISKPEEKENVKVFLENEIGIADLYIDNLLEI